MAVFRGEHVRLAVLSITVGIAAFVAVGGLFVMFGSPNGFTLGAILWFAIVSALISSVSVVQKRTTVVQPRVAVIGALVGGVLLLGPLWIPDLSSAGPQSDPTYSGKVASDENSGLSLQDPPGSESHSLALDKGDRVRIVIDGGATWEIQLPNGGSITSVNEESNARAVTPPGEGIYYTANQTGQHRIGIYVRPYQEASYRIFVEDAAS